MKPGDKVVVTGSRYTGERGTIRKKCKIAIPGDPQVEGWEVKVSSGPICFNEGELKVISNDEAGE